MPKKALVIPLFLLLSLSLFAQSESGSKEDIWFGLTGDMALYSASGIAYGGGLQLGFGSGTSLGLKLSWFFSPEKIDTIELNIIFRLYFRRNANSGLFIQIYSGPSIFFQNGQFELPAGSGMFSIGGGLGWRFIVFKHVYIEPFVRGGYPYQFGAGVSLGLRF